MKRMLLIACMAVILIPATLYAQPVENRFFIGAGGSWTITDSTDAEDSPGANFKLGYHAHRLLDIEFNFDWIEKFEERETVVFMNIPPNFRSELEIVTAMAGLKGYFPIPSDIVRLSVVVGGGLMYADVQVWDNNGILRSDVSDDELDFCGKVGLAFDVYVIPQFSIGAEGNYTFGIEDLNGLDYWNFNLGVAFHF
jgi:hypothetical protein